MIAPFRAEFDIAEYATCHRIFKRHVDDGEHVFEERWGRCRKNHRHDDDVSAYCHSNGKQLIYIYDPVSREKSLTNNIVVLHVITPSRGKASYLHQRKTAPDPLRSYV